MKIEIEIEKDLEEKLRECAERQGKELEQLIREMINETMSLIKKEYGK